MKDRMTANNNEQKSLACDRSNAVVNRLAAGFQRFQKRWFCKENNLYEDLQEGQNPLALVIACSDSRVDPALLTDSHPGELFVIRNVANVVPPYSPDQRYHGVSAALEYAVRHLQIPEIIVFGHANCGGVRALLEDTSVADDEFLSVWVQVVQRARDIVNQELPDATPEERCRACEMCAIVVSLENLLTFPWVRDAVSAGRLSIHGWYFDLNNGQLLYFNESEEAFLPLVEDCSMRAE